MELASFTPLIFLPLIVLWYLWNRQRMKKVESENTDKRVGAVATRMGLSVVKGDPNLSLLFFQQPSGDFERVIEMVGRPYGRAVTFWIKDGQKTSEYVVAAKITHSYGSAISLAFPNAPVFEVVLRNPNQYLVPNRDYDELPLSEVSTGSPLLDQQFIVRAENPRVGPALANALSMLSSHLYVHVSGGSNSITMSISRIGLPYVAQAAEEYMLALEAVACGLEGKPAPVRLPLTQPVAAQ